MSISRRILLAALDHRAAPPLAPAKSGNKIPPLLLRGRRRHRRLLRARIPAAPKSGPQTSQHHPASPRLKPSSTTKKSRGTFVLSRLNWFHHGEMDTVGAFEANTHLAACWTAWPGAKRSDTRHGIPAAMLVPVAEAEARLSHKDIVEIRRRLSGTLDPPQRPPRHPRRTASRDCAHDHEGLIPSDRLAASFSDTADAWWFAVAMTIHQELNRPFQVDGKRYVLCGCYRGTRHP